MEVRNAKSLTRFLSYKRPPRFRPRPRRVSMKTFATDGSRQPWEFGRFVKTVLFFNDPFERLRKMFTPSTQAQSTLQNQPLTTTTGPVLLFGAETDLGQDILDQLTKSGVSAKAMPSTEQSTPTKEATVDASLLSNASAVLITGAVSPSLKTALESVSKAAEKVVYNPSAAVQSMSWGSLDDVVMGGCSQSELTIQKGKADRAEYAAIFSGNITSANNGGFASVRTKNIDPALNLTGFDGLRLRIRGDGQRYKFMIRTSTDWDSIGYCKSFDTKEGWQDIVLPFSNFIPVFRAKSVSPPTPLEVKTIRSLQLMLSKFEYDGDLNPSVRMGRFELPIESMTAYSAEGEGPRIICLDVNNSDAEFIRNKSKAYTIIESDSAQTLPVKDSTLIQFCLVCLSEPSTVNATFKEQSRSSVSTKMTFPQLLDSFEKI